MIAYKLIISVFAFCILICGQARSQSLILQKGDSIIILVKANKHHTKTGIKVGHGETYQISASGKWQDAGFEPTDAEGFPPKNGVMRSAKFLKAMPKENYMKLIAKSGGAHYAIGNSANIIFRNGDLVLQANDAAFFFGNNSGTLTVAIKRLN